MIDIQDPYLRRLAQIESGMNPLAKNPNSSAGGLFQFIDSTAQQYGLEDRFNPEQSLNAAAKFTDDNRNYLRRRLGREPTPGELYLAHQQGAAGASRILENPDLPAADIVGQQAVALNAGGQSITAADFAKQWTSKFEDGYEAPQQAITGGEGQNIMGGAGQDVLTGGTGGDIIEVEAPDGTIIEFPAGMADAEIEAVMAREYPAAEPQKDAGIPGMIAGLGAGMADMTSFGFDDELRGFGRAVGSKIRGDERPFSELNRLGAQEIRDEGKQAQEAAPGSYLAGQITGAIAPAFTAPGAALARWAGSGGLGVRAAKGAAIAAPSAAAYGFGSGEGGALERTKSAAQYGAPALALGAALPVAGAAIKGGSKMIGGAVSPTIDKSKTAIVNLAKKYDVPLGLDDLTDSGFYKTLISEGKTIPFSGAAGKQSNQISKFTRAVSKTIGQDTDTISPQVVDDAFTSIGKEFDDFFKGQKLNIGNQYGGRVTSFTDEMDDLFGPDTPGIKQIQKYIADINKGVDAGGMVDGDILSKVRARANKAARNSPNPEIKGASREIENFIIDLVGDSKSVPKAAKEAFRKTKYKYKNLIAIEPLAAKAQIDGQISPSQLLGRVRQVYKREFSRGKAGELGDLANIGQLIKETVPNSGTAQRTGARNILTGNLGVAPFMAMANPVVGAAQGALSAAAMGGNRLMQSRNYNPKVVESALQRYGAQQPTLIGKAAAPAMSRASALERIRDR